MKVYTIMFQFRNTTRIANVYFSNGLGGYTIYFTDVELILEFGCKANYTKEKELTFLKSGKDSGILKAAICKQLEEVTHSV